jgi:trimeric autotransporter adhesin
MKTLLNSLAKKTIVFVFLFSMGKIMAQTNSQVYSTPGTFSFTVPAGIYHVTVEAYGAGGKGASCMQSAGIKAGGGGGGGAFASKIVSVIPGAMYTVKVGAGATSSNPGGDSWFGTTGTVLAKGGSSCYNNSIQGALGGQAINCVGDIAFSGGNGANGILFNYSGGGGSSATKTTKGENALTNTGGLTLCNLGSGGNGLINQNGNGTNGAFPGGGGGGAYRYQLLPEINNLGGNGANGQIVIRWETQQTGTALTASPGGVAQDIQLWLRADMVDGTIPVVNNTPINVWKTQAYGSNATKPTGVGAPILKNNSISNINFNPVIEFNNNNTTTIPTFTDSNPTSQYLKGTSGFCSQETFVVLIPSIPVAVSANPIDVFCGESFSCQSIERTGISLGNIDTRFSNEIISFTKGNQTGYGIAQTTTSNQFAIEGIINARNTTSNANTELFYNGQNIGSSEANSSAFGQINNSPFWIGRSKAYDGSFKGRIAEIITYNKRKNDVTERNKIESYLALKYGITLGASGISKDYVNSANTVVWNSNLNTGFNHKIAGIGRDDISKLNQKQSTSSVANPIITIGLGTIETTNSANASLFLADKQFLVWGENNLSMTDSGVDLILPIQNTNFNSVFDILRKKWKIVETGGDVSTVKIALPTARLSGLPQLVENDRYVMIVADDMNFTQNVKTVVLKTNGSNQETFFDFDGTKFFTFGVGHELTQNSQASFNGINSYLKSGNDTNLPAQYTASFWVRPTGQNALNSDRVIAAKFDGTNGYRIYLSANNKINFKIGTTLLTSSVALPNAEWHNITYVFESNTLKLYIDGVLDTSMAAAIPTVTTTPFSIGAEYRSKTDIRNFFNGDIDEFKLWNRAIALDQIRFMMNQEIVKDGTTCRGKLSPNPLVNVLANTNWNELISYYDMNAIIGTQIIDKSDTKEALTFLSNVNSQTAPLPYKTGTNGLWQNQSTWLNGAIQPRICAPSIVDASTLICWNIAETDHNISTTANRVLLGLFVNSGAIIVENNSKIQVTHYLKLNGKIDLVDESQLIQTSTSYLDPTSTGFIERDQQGQSNSFNYNYWSSPVSTVNNTQINNGYTVASVMKDGSISSNPLALSWTSGLNGFPSNPITLSRHWLYKFDESTVTGWSFVGENGFINSGQGFTMKGSGAMTSTQNYTFVGKPNNGTIQTPISANKMRLVGNPYSSALDADKFIRDNSNVITGTIYFWEQFQTNNSHYTADYQAGYAARTLVGGTPPVTKTGTSSLGSSSKIAKRFIPVGQGFFVTASATGGNLTFSNEQRIFIKETNTNSYSLFRTDNQTTSIPANIDIDNTEDDYVEDNFSKLRIGFESPTEYHRQILLGFMNQYATSAYDNGYDAIHIDIQPSDMYFMLNGTKLNIQGVGAFNNNAIYPITVKNDVNGNVKFTLDETENLDQNQDVFIHDSLTDTYHNIKNQDASIYLDAGTFDNRFSLRFVNPISLGVNENFENEEFTIFFSTSNATVTIKNQNNEAQVNQVNLFNMLGQKVTSWNIQNPTQSTINLPATSISTGPYIVQVLTSKGILKKKILIK